MEEKTRYIMELLDIIVYSLKIFCITIILTITFSYLIYKIKDRKRTKPYLRPVKNNAPAIKIEFLDSEARSDHFEKLNFPSIIPVKVNSSNERKFIQVQPKLIKYIPEIDEQFILKKVIENNFDILEHYSVEDGEKMYKVKV